MININDLEARHRKYKIKSYFPYFTVLISVVAISASIIIIFKYNSIVSIANNDAKIKDEIITNSAPITKEVPKEAIAVIEQPTPEEEKAPMPQIIIQTDKVDKLILAPSMDFMRNLQAITPTYYESDNNIIDKKPPAPEKIIKATTKSSDLNKTKKKKREEVVLDIEKKAPLNIKRKESDNDIQQVIKRFTVNNNPALSLFVAKKYYQLEEYEKAYNYALITNNINNNIEESWIVFAQSLVKLNKKDMAVETLKQYVDHSHSSQGKILLDEILSGKFK